MPNLDDIDRKLRAAIVQRYRAGESMQEIAPLFGIGWKKVREVVVDAGVRIRQGPEYRTTK